MNDRPPDAAGSDEPWEQEVAGLLGRLPPVEPPAGFLARAVDHRPLHAGRTVVLLAALAAAGLGVTVAVQPTPAPADDVVTAPADGAGPDADGEPPTSVVGLGRQQGTPDLGSSLSTRLGEGLETVARRLGFPAP